MTVVFSGLEDQLPKHIREGSISPSLSLQFLDRFLLALKQVVLLFVPDIYLTLDGTHEYEQDQNTQDNDVDLFAQVADEDADDGDQRAYQGVKLLLQHSWQVVPEIRCYPQSDYVDCDRCDKGARFSQLVHQNKVGINQCAVENVVREVYPGQNQRLFLNSVVLVDDLKQVVLTNQVHKGHQDQNQCAENDCCTVVGVIGGYELDSH